MDATLQHPVPPFLFCAPGAWRCSLCRVENDENAVCCMACERPRFAKQPEDQLPVSLIPTKQSVSSWKCGVCLIVNDSETEKCEACDSARIQEKKTVSSSASVLFGPGLFTNSNHSESVPSTSFPFMDQLKSTSSGPLIFGLPDTMKSQIPENDYSSDSKPMISTGFNHFTSSISFKNPSVPKLFSSSPNMFSLQTHEMIEDSISLPSSKDKVMSENITTTDTSSLFHSTPTRHPIDPLFENDTNDELNRLVATNGTDINGSPFIQHSGLEDPSTPQIINDSFNLQSKNNQPFNRLSVLSSYQNRSSDTTHSFGSNITQFLQKRSRQYLDNLVNSSPMELDHSINHHNEEDEKEEDKIRGTKRLRLSPSSSPLSTPHIRSGTSIQQETDDIPLFVPRLLGNRSPGISSAPVGHRQQTHHQSILSPCRSPSSYIFDNDLTKNHTIPFQLQESSSPNQRHMNDTPMTQKDSILITSCLDNVNKGLQEAIVDRIGTTSESSIVYPTSDLNDIHLDSATPIPLLNHIERFSDDTTHLHPHQDIIDSESKAYRFSFGVVTSINTTDPSMELDLTSNSVLYNGGSTPDNQTPYFATPTFGSSGTGNIEQPIQDKNMISDTITKTHHSFVQHETSSIDHTIDILPDNDNLNNLSPSDHHSIICQPDRNHLMDAAGIVYIWGSGDCDQLAIADQHLTEHGAAPSPLLVVKLKKQKAISISCGALHSVVLLADGSVVTWGCNDDFALGRLNTIPERKPARVEGLPVNDPVIAISSGDSHSACITTNGQCFIWGSYKDSMGYLGFPNYHSDNPCSIKEKKTHIPTLVLNLSGRCIRLSSGENHTAVLCIPHSIMEDSYPMLYCWGSGEFGQLGTPPFSDTDPNKSIYLYPQLFNHDLLGVTGLITNVFCGKATTFIEKRLHNNDPHYYGMGRNSCGELGIGRLQDIITFPEELHTFSGIELTNISSCQFASLALTHDGQLYTWGKKEYLGKPYIKSNEPVQSTPELNEFFDKKVNTIGTGGDTMFAVTDPGLLYSWGEGQMYQIGDGNEYTDPVYTPLLISPSYFNHHSVLSVSGGSQHSLSLVFSNEYRLSEQHELSKISNLYGDSLYQLFTKDDTINRRSKRQRQINRKEKPSPKRPKGDTTLVDSFIVSSSMTNIHEKSSICLIDSKLQTVDSSNDSLETTCISTMDDAKNPIQRRQFPEVSSITSVSLSNSTKTTVPLQQLPRSNHAKQIKVATRSSKKKASKPVVDEEDEIPNAIIEIEEDDETLEQGPSILKRRHTLRRQNNIKSKLNTNNQNASVQLHNDHSIDSSQHIVRKPGRPKKILKDSTVTLPNESLSIGKPKRGRPPKLLQQLSHEETKEIVSDSDIQQLKSTTRGRPKGTSKHVNPDNKSSLNATSNDLLLNSREVRAARRGAAKQHISGITHDIQDNHHIHDSQEFGKGKNTSTISYKEDNNHLDTNELSTVGKTYQDHPIISIPQDDLITTSKQHTIKIDKRRKQKKP